MTTWNVVTLRRLGASPTPLKHPRKIHIFLYSVRSYPSYSTCDHPMLGERWFGPFSIRTVVALNVGNLHYYCTGRLN